MLRAVHSLDPLAVAGGGLIRHAQVDADRRVAQRERLLADTAEHQVHVKAGIGASDTDELRREAGQLPVGLGCGPRQSLDPQNESPLTTLPEYGRLACLAAREDALNAWSTRESVASASRWYTLPSIAGSDLRSSASWLYWSKYGTANLAFLPSRLRRRQRLVVQPAQLTQHGIDACASRFAKLPALMECDRSRRRLQRIACKTCCQPPSQLRCNWS